MLIAICIALVVLLMSPAISASALLALTTPLAIVLIIVLLRTSRTQAHDTSEAVAEDARNIACEVFAALARDPGATTASFRVVDGVVVHGGPSWRGGSTGGIRSDEEDSVSQDAFETDREEAEQRPDYTRAWDAGPPNSGSGRGRVVVRILGGS